MLRILQSCFCAALVATLFANADLAPASANEPTADNVLLVTIDGLRWQEVFQGADVRLMNRELGGVSDAEALKARFWADDTVRRRKMLMPFLWEVIATRGQLFGDLDQQSVARVTNGRYFSYPGYNEILSGFSDPKIDSNAKIPNSNVTVLEWLHRKPAYANQVAAFCSWDVFPYILNAERSGIYVNAGWEPLTVFPSPKTAKMWQRLADELPHYWDNVRYDVFTARGMLAYLQVHQPRVMYLALGETDDWAHAGRYDLYLDAALRNDQYLKEIWEALQSFDSHRGRTTMIITTDHGRGHVRDGWKNHGADVPGAEQIWVAAIGPSVPSLGVRTQISITQSQIAPTVAAVLGESFNESDSRVADPLPLEAP